MFENVQRDSIEYQSNAQEKYSIVFLKRLVPISVNVDPVKSLTKSFPKKHLQKCLELTWKMPSFHGDMLGCSQHAGCCKPAYPCHSYPGSWDCPPYRRITKEYRFLLCLLPWRRTPEIGHFVSRPILVAGG